MKKSLNRREFGHLCGGLAATALAVPVSWAEDLPDLDPAGPQAAALGYTEDASQVDTAKHANYIAGSTCTNCLQYQGGDERGKCNIFVGSLVKANGWCTVWVKKPA
ncbi:MAG: high-potential iron-sulfur protein [Gammaproteobacteria bacterium]|nr:high-potential iron-sulfur protein [Gammaproteobacteria bacterium]MCZ6892967.1 high-potential iron-sulfur protein [Gammaproteobacteria bacterium]